MDTVDYLCHNFDTLRRILTLHKSSYIEIHGLFYCNKQSNQY